MWKGQPSLTLDDDVPDVKYIEPKLPDIPMLKGKVQPETIAQQKRIFAAAQRVQPELPKGADFARLSAAESELAYLKSRKEIPEHFNIHNPISFVLHTKPFSPAGSEPRLHRKSKYRRKQ